MILSQRWKEYFYDVALRTAEMSKDPSTKVGAVIIRPDKTIASVGFNGFPRFVPDEDAHYSDRSEKYLRVVHAEANAILSAHEPVRGHMIVTTHQPCAKCTGLIIQAGIASVFCPEPSDDMRSRWHEDFKIAEHMLRSTGVVLYPIG